MPLRIETTPLSASMRSPRRLLPCPHCGDTLLAPEQSEFQGSGLIRHYWSCDSCGERCETSVAVTAHRTAASRPEQAVLSDVLKAATALQEIVP